MGSNQATVPGNPGNLTLALEVELYGRVIRTGATPGAAAGGFVGVQSEPSNQAFDAVGIGDHDIITGASGISIAIHMLLLYNAADAQTLELREDADNLMGPIRALASGVGLFLPWTDEPYFVLKAGRSFRLTASALLGPTSEATGFVKYRLRPA